MQAEATGVSPASSLEKAAGQAQSPGHEKPAGQNQANTVSNKRFSFADSPDVVLVDYHPDRKEDWTGYLEFLNHKVCYTDTAPAFRQHSQTLMMQQSDMPKNHMKCWFCLRRLVAVMMKPKTVKELEQHRPFANLRTSVGRWVMSTPVQILVMVAILTDISAMIFKVSKDPENAVGFGAGSEDDSIYTEAQLTTFLVIDWVVCVVLGLEVLCRWFHYGREFFAATPTSQAWLNIMEFTLVPVMLFELLTRDDDVNVGVPLPVLRALRPFIRCVNLIAKAFRGFSHAVKLRNAIQEQVAGTHKRYISEGFNLDLCYINAQLIAMGRPSTGKDVLFNNPLSEVVRFFDMKHRDKFIIINTSESIGYSAWNFHHRVIRFPILEHSVPRLVDLHELCSAMKTFLEHDQDHVIAVHGHAGGGQIGVVVAAYLLHCGAFRQAISAMSNYERTRTAPGATETVQGFDSASQRRFVEYFSSCVHELHCVPCENTPDPPIKAKLLSIRLLGVDMESLGSVNVRIFLRRQRNRRGAKAEGTSTTEVDRPSEKSDTQSSSKEGWTTPRTLDLKEEEKSGNLPEDEEALMMMIQEENMALIQLAQEEKSKHAFDAPSSGCLPQVGTPFIDTNEHAEATCKGKVVMQGGEDPLDSGNIVAWRFENVELAGEICVEVHATSQRKEKKSKTKSPRSNSRRKDVGSGMQKIRTKMMSGRSVVANTPSDAGKSQDMSDFASDAPETRMLFCAWFHTSFLEANQSMSLRRELGDKSIGITLGRFNVDKAAGAPSLQTYGASFQMQLMFEVEEGLDTRPRNTVGRMNHNEESEEGRNELTRLHPPNMMTDVSEVCEIGWLTWFVNKLWPYTEVALVRLIRDVVEPLLQDAMPANFVRIQFVKFTLGTATPQLGPVVASHRTGDEKNKGIQLDLALKYRGDVNILMATGVAEIGINQVFLSGTLSILLDPIVDTVPIVGGMKLFFLNPPKVKLQFVGLAEWGTAIPGMEKMVQSTIHDALAGSLVLPNVLAIDWRPEVYTTGEPTVRLKNRLPTGVLRVVVKEARGLQLESNNRLYVTLTFGAMKQKSGLCKKTSNESGYQLTWQETCDLLYYDPQQNLDIEVYTKEGIGKTDRLIARSQNMMADSLLRSSSGPQWVVLDGVDNGAWRKSKGRINENRMSKLFATSTPKHHNAQSDTTSRLLIHVQLNELIDDAQRLPPSAQDGAQESSANDCNVPTALLICNVMKARVPPDRVQGTSICVRVGDMEVERKGMLADETWKTVTEITRDSLVNAIEVLVHEGFSSAKIAEALGKEEPLVEKIAAHCLGYNISCAQHMCVMVRPADLRGGNIEFEIKRKGRVDAQARVPIKSVVAAENMKLRKAVIMHSGPAGSSRHRARKNDAASQNHAHRFDLDVEMHLFAFSLAKRSNEVEAFPSEEDDSESPDKTKRPQGRTKTSTTGKIPSTLPSDSPVQHVFI